MPLQQNNHSITYTCDKPGCAARHVAPSKDYRKAWEHAKAAGWRALKVGNVWMRWCDWTHIPSNMELKEMARATTGTGLDGQAGSAAADSHGRT